MHRIILGVLLDTLDVQLAPITTGNWLFETSTKSVSSLKKNKENMQHTYTNQMWTAFNNVLCDFIRLVVSIEFRCLFVKYF